MFNTGFRGKRASDGTGIINPQEQFVQNKYPVPTITSWSISGSDDDALDPAGGQTVLVNGGGFAAGCAVTVNGTTVTPVTVVSPNQISFTSPANSGGSYTLIVYNSTGGGAILVPGLVYSSVPTYTTAQGSIGSGYETTSINTSVVATSDSTITYAITSGALPSGASMTSGGVITGTYPTLSVGTSETFYFDITATDEEDQDVTRSFTLTTNIDVVTWVTPSSGSTINLDGTAYSQALTATDAASYSLSYTANALPTGLTLSSGTISGTPTVEGTTSTLLTATAATTGRSAENTITWVVALNDTYFKYNTMLLSANSSIQTSSFVSDASINNTQLTVAGDTRATDFNPYQVGYYSYQFNGSTDYFTLPVTTTLAFSGDYTIECWVYLNSVTGLQGVYSSIDSSGDSWQGPYIGFSGTSFLATSYIGSTDTITHQTTVAAGAWYHIAMVRFGNITKSYLNGVQSTGTTTSTYSLTQSGGTIGSAYPGTSPLNGYISNLRVVTGAALYTTGFTPPTGPLTSIPNTVLLTGQSGTFVDNSPSVHALTLAGTPKASTANPFSTVYQADTYKYSTNFDGNGDYITTAGNTALDMGTGDFTIECFVTTKGYAGTQYGRGLFALYPSGNYNNRMIVRHTNADNRFNIYGALSGGTYFGTNGTDGTKALTAGLWYHIAFVRNSGVFRLYINGVQDIVVTGQSAISLAGSNCFDIGRCQDGSVPDWNGTISNFRVIKGTCLYPDGTTFNPPTSTLTAVSGTSLLTCQDATIKDNSTNAITLTVTASAKPIPVTPFTSTYYSNSFDGSGDYLTLPSNQTQFTMGTGDFTVEMWVNVSSYAAQRTLYDTMNGGDTSGTGRFALEITTSGILRVFSGAGTILTSSTSTTITAGTWNHVAYVRISNSGKLYINGTQVNTTYTDNNNYVVGTTSRPIIGINAYDNSSNPMFGSISNLRVVKGVGVYTGTFTPPTSPLTATQSAGTNISAITGTQTSLLTCQSLFFVDNSTNAFKVTPTGSVVVPLAPFTQPSSYTSTQITTYGSGYFANTGASNTSWILGPTLPAFGTSDHTIEFWMYQVTSPQTYATAWRYAGGATQQATNDYYISTGASGGSILVGGGGSWTVSLSFTVPSNNAWHHYALTRSGTSWKMYVDGVLANTASGNPTLAAPGSAMVIASSAASAANGVYIQGYITNFRIVLGTALYTSNFLPQFTSPLSNVTNTQLLTLQYNGSHNNNVFKDKSSFNNLITRTANVTNGTFSPYGDNWSMLFNGSNSYLQFPTATATAFGGFNGNYTTIECWVNQTSTSTSSYANDVMGAFAAVAANGRFQIGLGSAASANSPSKLEFTWTTSTGTTDSIQTTAAFPVGTWVHLAVVVNATGSAGSHTVDVYINGTRESFTGRNFSSQTSTYDRLCLGGFTTGYFNGYISNFRFTRATTNTVGYSGSTINVPTSALQPVSGTKLLFNSNRFFDASVIQSTFTIYNNPSIQKFSPFNTVTVSKYYSTYFSAKTDFLSIPATTSVTTLTGDFTIELWVCPSTAAVTSAYTGFGILDARSNGATAAAWVLGLNDYSSGWLMNYFNGTSYSGNIRILENVWTHCAWVRSGSTMTFYVNGVAGGTANISGTQTGGTTTVTIGSKDNSLSGYGTIGFFSNLRLVNGIAVYTGNFTPPTSPLTRTQSAGTNIAAITGTETKLLTCQDNTFIDNSTNNATVSQGTTTIRPMAISPFASTASSVLTYSPTTFSGSTYYDGTGDYLTLPAGSPSAKLLAGAFTWETWIYPISSASTVLFGSWNNGSNQWAFEYAHSGLWSLSARLIMYVGNYGSNECAKYSTTQLQLNTWSHIAWVRTSANAISMYVNGVTQTLTTYNSSATWSDSYSNTNSVAYGIGGVSNYAAFQGYLSDMRYVPGAALYTSNFYPNVAPLAPTKTIGSSTYGSSLLLTGTSGGVIDATRTVDLETAADVKVTNFSPYNGSYYSVYFSGSSYLTTSATLTAWGTNDFTVEMWLYVTTSGTYNVFDYTPAGGNGAYFNFYLNSNTPYLYVNSANRITGSSALLVGTWYHIAISRVSGNTRMFVNGTQSGSTYNDSTSYLSPANRPVIGTSGNNVGANYFPGYISNLRVINGTGSTTFTTPTAPLAIVSGTQLLTCQSNKFIDNSANAYTITPSGTPKVATQNPFQVNSGQSYYFDGTGDYLTSPNTPSFGFGTGDYTIEFWLYLTSIPGSGSKYTLMDFRAVNGSTPHTCYVNNSAGTLYLGFFNGTSDVTTTSQPLTTGSWYHCAWRRASSTLTIFVNGVQAYSASHTVDYLSSRPLVIGASVGFTEPVFGYISDLRITKGYARTITVPTAPYKTN